MKWLIFFNFQFLAFNEKNWIWSGNWNGEKLKMEHNCFLLNWKSTFHPKYTPFSHFSGSHYCCVLLITFCRKLWPDRIEICVLKYVTWLSPWHSGTPGMWMLVFLGNSNRENCTVGLLFPIPCQWVMVLCLGQLWCSAR